MNKKITPVLESPKDYIIYHRILWNAIVKYLKENPGVNSNGTEVKEKVFHAVFNKSVRITDNCFGCEFAIKNVTFTGFSFGSCSRCLFKRESSCLNGKWSFFHRFPSVENAEAILNFPIKPEYVTC